MRSASAAASDSAGGGCSCAAAAELLLALLGVFCFYPSSLAKAMMDSVQNPHKSSGNKYLYGKIMYVVTPRRAAAAVASAVVLRQRIYTCPYSMIHCRLTAAGFEVAPHYHQLLVHPVSGSITTVHTRYRITAPHYFAYTSGTIVTLSTKGMFQPQPRKSCNTDPGSHTIVGSAPTTIRNVHFLPSWTLSCPLYISPHQAQPCDCFLGY